MDHHDWRLDKNQLSATIGNKPVVIRPIGHYPGSLHIAPPELSPSRFCLLEWQEYLIRGADLVEGATEIHQLDDDLIRVRYANQIGRAFLQFRVGRDRGALPVEILSTKYPAPSKHIAFYGRLLTDLTEEAIQLPFTISSPTAMTVDESPVQPTPLFIFHFFEQYNVELRRAMEIITASPHRKLADSPRWVRVGQTRVVNPAVLQMLVTNPEHLVPVPPGSVACAEYMMGQAPSRVFQDLSTNTFDTPENRFALAAMKLFLRAIQDLLHSPWLSKVTWRKRQRLQELASFIAQSLNSPLWDEVGEMRIIPASSQVLQRRYGYRELLLLWRLFQVARQPFFADLQSAIEIRDVATLYEYWCFFELGRRLSDLFGPPDRAKVEINDSDGLLYESSLEWSNRGRLIFNRMFRPSDRTSYSVALRPDFVFIPSAEAGNQRLVVLDAKFRFTTRDWRHADQEDDPKRQANRADIYKMHTYRDALAAQAAIVLYPGDQPVFYHASHHTVSDVPTLADVLQFDGVGALCMEPRQEGSNHGQF